MGIFLIKLKQTQSISPQRASLCSAHCAPPWINYQKQLNFMRKMLQHKDVVKPVTVVDPRFLICWTFARFAEEAITLCAAHISRLRVDSTFLAKTQNTVFYALRRMLIKYCSAPPPPKPDKSKLAQLFCLISNHCWPRWCQPRHNLSISWDGAGLDLE